MDLNRVFGDNVRTRRMALGMTQEELADKANLHRTYISYIENSTRNVTLETVEKVAKALDTDAWKLIIAPNH